MTNVMGVTEIKYFQHRSKGSVIEIFLKLGKVIKQHILKRVRAASCFGIIESLGCLDGLPSGRQH